MRENIGDFLCWLVIAIGLALFVYWSTGAGLYAEIVTQLTAMVSRMIS